MFEDPSNNEIIENIVRVAQHTPISDDDHKYIIGEAFYHYQNRLDKVLSIDLFKYAVDNGLTTCLNLKKATEEQMDYYRSKRQ